MKIGILFKAFNDIHKAKDTGRIAQELTQRGNNVVIFTSQENVSNDDVIYRIKFFGLTYEDMSQCLDDEKLDILMIYHLSFEFIRIGEYAKSKGIRIIFKLDTDGNMPILGSNTIRTGIYYSTKKSINALLNFSFIEMANKLFNLADFVVIESSVAYRRYISYFPQFASKFQIIPNGCSFPLFQEYEKMNSVVAIGTFNHTGHKRPKRLIKAFLHAAHLRPDWKLIMLGNVPVNLLREYKFQKNIIFLGKCSYGEVIYHLENSKILLLSSQYEGFPNVFPEALSRNCTICSTPVPAARDVVCGYELGTISEDYTHKDLGHALLAEMILWENGCRIQKKIYEFAKPKYSINNIIDSMVRLFVAPNQGQLVS